LPFVWHRLAEPVEVQVGAASASGATAIATALAAASVGMNFRILINARLLVDAPI
jgi:cysteine synthase